MTKVANYRMVAKNGRHIRVATQVTFADGYVVRFVERMPKFTAIRQATELQRKNACPKCGGTGWLHGAQEWTPERMSKGTPYKSVRCDCRLTHPAS